MVDQSENDFGKDRVSDEEWAYAMSETPDDVSDEEWARAMGDAPDDSAVPENTSQEGEASNLDGEAGANGEAEDVNPYKVGYRKPPKHSQFKPGQSGNLKGAPKKNLKASLPETFSADFLAIADEMVPVTIDGKRKKMSLHLAILRSIMIKAAQGERWASILYTETREKLSKDAAMATKEFFENILHMKEHEGSMGAVLLKLMEFEEDAAMIDYLRKNGTQDIRKSMINNATKNKR